MARRRIVAPGPKPITLNPVRPNEGLGAAYRRKLLAKIDEMNASLEYWLLSAYRNNTPAMAQDATPAAELQRAFKRLGERWQRQFDYMAPKLGAWFAESAAERSDSSMRAILKDAGWTVELRMTPEVRDIVRAVTVENVGLIKSIASQHLTQIEGIVMRATTTGRDMGTLAKELQAQFGVSKRRAAFISRDQLSKSTAAVTRARQVECGITKARWIHSSAGRHPRKSHQDFSGKEYDVAKGAYLDGEWVWPGTAINCRCVCAAILPALQSKRA